MGDIFASAISNLSQERYSRDEVAAIIRMLHGCLQPTRDERHEAARAEFRAAHNPMSGRLQSVQNDLVKAIRYCRNADGEHEDIPDYLLDDLVYWISRDSTLFPNRVFLHKIGSVGADYATISEYVAAFCRNLTAEHVDQIAGIEAANKFKEDLE